MTQDEMREDPLYEYFLDLAHDDLEEADERDVRMVVAQSFEAGINNFAAVPIWHRFWWYLTASAMLANIVRVLHFKRWPLSRKTLIAMRAMAIKDAAREMLENPT